MSDHGADLIGRAQRADSRKAKRRFAGPTRRPARIPATISAPPSRPAPPPTFTGTISPPPPPGTRPTIPKGAARLPPPTPTTTELTDMATTSRATRRASLANAHAARSAGAGATGTAPRQTTNASLLSRIGSAAIGFVSGGVPGAIAGAVTDPLGSRGGGGTPSRPNPPTRGFAPSGAMSPCPPGRIRLGSSCIDPLALPPGGRPAVVPTSGTNVTGIAAGGGAAVMGGFGMPAMVPQVETRLHRECGPGMVLGKDNLCYPKAILSRRSKFRKWRQPPRPPITSADMKAIRRAARARDRVQELAQDVGFKKPKRK